jgi:DNA (cytosine-5)-methyltransferase 1
LRFLDYVLEIKPSIVLMENVPDVMNSGGHNVPEETCGVLSENGYDCGYTLLNAAYYGVPEMRERMYLIAWSKEFKTPISFPEPTHWIELPVGYNGTRSVALKNLGKSIGQKNLKISPEDFFLTPPSSKPRLPNAITAKDALKDLPPIDLHLRGELKRGARRFDQFFPYRKGVKPTGYRKLMRSWPHFESNGGVYDHVIRFLPRDYPIFRRMNAGDQYPEAHKHAENLLEEEIERRTKAGGNLTDDETATLRKQIVPPYDVSKFPNKWRKMEADLPARTIMAHIGKDSYSHIHYDSDQARTISVREAARIQSFPDGFKFSGTMNPALRQIGNAVPPLMSYALANHIRKTLDF